jgi:hypothetical protein
MLSQSTSQSSSRKPHVPESPSLYAEIDKVVTRVAVGLLITSGCGLGALIALSASFTLPFLWPAVGVLVGFAVVGVIAIIASEVLRSKDRALRKVNNDIHILIQKLLRDSKSCVSKASCKSSRTGTTQAKKINDEVVKLSRCRQTQGRSLKLDDAHEQMRKLIGLGLRLDAILLQQREERSDISPTRRVASGMRNFGLATSMGS